MLIAVCGSQGTGKSTLLNALATTDDYVVVERKTSRSILKEWGVTLDEVNTTPKLCMEFQEEILQRKWHDEHQSVIDHPGKHILTERTFVDLATYAIVSLGGRNEYDSWLNDYIDKCCSYQQHYDRIVFLPNGKFAVVDDGVRGINQYYSTLVDLMMTNLTQRWSLKHPTYAKPITLHSVDIQERVREFNLIVKHK